jgi:hypothetical protein
VALRWTAAGMLEAAKGFRRLKAYKPLRALRAADCSPSQVRDRKQAEENLNVASSSVKNSVSGQFELGG